MSLEEIRKCREHVREALEIMERDADAQPEVHILISLRELEADIAWLEAFEGCQGNIVRLSDVRHLRSIGA